MPIRTTLWKVGPQPQALTESVLASEIERLHWAIICISKRIDTGPRLLPASISTLFGTRQ
jgi:hypothetical protein